MKFTEKLKQINPLFLIKTGIGSAAAILIADSMGFLYSPSAGIITLLTIQNTKKETLLIAVKRFEAFVLATILAYGIFTVLGYTPVTFGLFVLLFVGVCILTGLKDGIAMNTVLMTHFLIEKHFDLPLVLNELGILTIGMGIGILLNLIMLSNKKKIREEQLKFEEEQKTVLLRMAGLLKKQEDDDIDFTILEVRLEELLKRAYEEAGNTFLSDTRYLVSYLEMRKLQLEVLRSITDDIKGIPVLLRQTYPIADFIRHISESFHELNNAEGLLTELEQLKNYYRQETLPKTREEFEYRAVLFQILKELEYFLILKRNFVLNLEKKNLKTYWTR